MKNLIALTLFSLTGFTALETTFASNAAAESSQEEPWSSLVSKFTDAFNRGDVATLESLKQSWRSRGFYNINDLGGMFMKYGAGMDQWPQLIEDAKMNAKK